MPLEREINEDDLRAMSQAIVKTEKGYQASYFPSGFVSAFQSRAVDDKHIVVSKFAFGLSLPFSVLHLGEESRVDSLCHQAVINHLLEYTKVFEGRLYDKDCHPKRNRKGEIYICPETTLPEDIPANA